MTHIPASAGVEMRRERAEAVIVGAALIGLVVFLACGFLLAVTYGVTWLLS